MKNKKILTTIFILFILVVLGYVLYTARFIIYGPRLLLDVPGGIITVKSQVIEITGTAINATELKLNNREILVTDKGVFNEKMLLSVGGNIFVFDAKDKFGHSTSETLQVIYTPDTDDVLQLKNVTNDSN